MVIGRLRSDDIYNQVIVTCIYLYIRITDFVVYDFTSVIQKELNTFTERLNFVLK